MIEVKLSSAFSSFTQGSLKFKIKASDIFDLVNQLDLKYPGMKQRVVINETTIQRFVVIYKNKEDVRNSDGLKTKLSAGDQVTILQALSGG
jgi:molybdopterin converting factor small subunit